MKAVKNLYGKTKVERIIRRIRQGINELEKEVQIQNLEKELNDYDDLDDPVSPDTESLRDFL